MRRWLLVSVVAIAVVTLGLVGWVVLRPDSPAPLSVDDISADGTDVSNDPAAGIDGTWTVVVGGDSQAGLRIEEDRFGGLTDNTAVGRTSDVTGTLTVQDTAVADGSFTVDLSTVEFTDDPGLPVANRSVYLRTRALETDRFPNATFELSEPIELDDVPDDGDTVTATATGRLTLHGVTRAATFEVEAKVAGNSVILATAEPVPVRLADHDITAPAIAGVSEVRDTGEFEFVVVLRRS